MPSRSSRSPIAGSASTNAGASRPSPTSNDASKETPMAESRFLYLTYIRAPAQTVWNALTDPAQNRLFWSGYHQQSSWDVGGDFAIVSQDGQAWDTGKV